MEIPNPIRWYYAAQVDAEWWHRGGETRDMAIDKGRAMYPGELFWIAQARNMVPSFAIFDADDLCERLNEDECWGEDGWTGQPPTTANAELERRLEEVFANWVAEFGTLDGASLDEISSEPVEPSSPAAGR